MPDPLQSQAIAALEEAVPRLQRDFLLAGPLEGKLPADIRAEFVRVFTQVLCRAIDGGASGELARFTESVIWEARKLGAHPTTFLTWVDRYENLARQAIDRQAWPVIVPHLDIVRERIVHIQN